MQHGQQETRDEEPARPSLIARETPEAARDTAEDAGLLATLAGEVRREGRWRAYRLALAVALGYAASLAGTAATEALGAPAGLVLIVGLVALAVRLAAPSRRYREMARRLAGWEDRRAVPELLGLLAIEQRAVRGPVVAALVRLLPELRATDAPLLTGSHHQRIAAILRARTSHRRWCGTDLKLAALRALEQVGDDRAAALVTELADGKVAGADPAVRAQAAASLPAVRTAWERRRLGRTLLRAAAAPPGAASLLRPAGPAGTPSGNLLRPGEPPRGGSQSDAG
ncbi:MAG: hypothetical protein IT208_07100 [Chthonomonadales bacterium]|nr:hypothetical protein [Chthonomonadales bacterium]